MNPAVCNGNLRRFRMAATIPIYDQYITHAMATPQLMTPVSSTKALKTRQITCTSIVNRSEPLRVTLVLSDMVCSIMISIGNLGHRSLARNGFWKNCYSPGAGYEVYYHIIQLFQFTEFRIMNFGRDILYLFQKLIACFRLLTLRVNRLDLCP